MPIKNIGYPKQNDNVVIGDNEVGRNRKPIGYLCPSCNIKMVKLSDEEYSCNRCQHSEYIENMAQTAEIPEPQTLDNTEVNVVIPVSINSLTDICKQIVFHVKVEPFSSEVFSNFVYKVCK